MKDLLTKEIQNELETLGDMSVGTDEYKTAVDGLTKLMDRAIELDKLEAEREDKYYIHEREYELKNQQANSEDKDRKVRNGIAIAGIVIPTVVTIWGTLKSFKFEETGTVTTMLGRGFINKLLPKK